MAIRAEVEAQIRTERFHEQGATEFTDWKARCDDLVKMGADAGFASCWSRCRMACVSPARWQRTPRRWSALPACTVNARGLSRWASSPPHSGPNNGNGHARAAAPLPVTRAPAPVRPVTGRAAPVFNEYTGTRRRQLGRLLPQERPGTRQGQAVMP